MQHRIFLVRPLGDAPHVAQREHWEHRHGPLFAGLAGLRGYRQNRPSDAEWEAGRGWICSETWFDDRKGETTSYASDFYRTDVTDDEASFLDRDGAWQAAVLGSTGMPTELPTEPAPWRVLWFGAEPPAQLPDGVRWETSDLTRPAPGTDTPARLHSAWFATEEDAVNVASGAPHGVVAFACRPRSFVVGPRTREEQS